MVEWNQITTVNMVFIAGLIFNIVFFWWSSGLRSKTKEKK